jgi:hypothetical protein
MGLLVLGGGYKLEKALGAFVLAIGVLNIIVGWGQPSDGKDALLE